MQREAKIQIVLERIREKGYEEEKLELGASEGGWDKVRECVNKDLYGCKQGKSTQAIL